MDTYWDIVDVKRLIGLMDSLLLLMDWIRFFDFWLFGRRDVLIIFFLFRRGGMDSSRRLWLLFDVLLLLLRFGILSFEAFFDSFDLLVDSCCATVIFLLQGQLLSFFEII